MKFRIKIDTALGVLENNLRAHQEELKNATEVWAEELKGTLTGVAAAVDREGRPGADARPGPQEDRSCMKWLSRLLCWVGCHDWRNMDGRCCECGYDDPLWKEWYGP